MCEECEGVCEGVRVRVCEECEGVCEGVYEGGEGV